VLIKDALQELPERLSLVSDSPSIDTQVLLAHFTGKTRTWVLAHPETVLTYEQENLLHQAFERLQTGEPLPYILGYREFFGIRYTISHAVLIPRPETELLVEKALEWLENHPGKRFAVDVGTGSGCIAITLAINKPSLHILASDISLEALKITTLNISEHEVKEQVLPVVAYLFPPIKKRFDLICANLPYVPTERLKSLPIFGKEPQLALDGGELGFNLIKEIILEAPRRLVDGGGMFLEIDDTHRIVTKRLARETFPSASTTVLQDLSGKDRLLIVQT
jgi:release factor glutamine methyltransferase